MCRNQWILYTHSNTEGGLGGCQPSPTKYLPSVHSQWLLTQSHLLPLLCYASHPALQQSQLSSKLEFAATTLRYFYWLISSRTAAAATTLLLPIHSSTILSMATRGRLQSKVHGTASALERLSSHHNSMVGWWREAAWVEQRVWFHLFNELDGEPSSIWSGFEPQSRTGFHALSNESSNYDKSIQQEQRM